MDVVALVFGGLEAADALSQLVGHLVPEGLEASDEEALAGGKDKMQAIDDMGLHGIVAEPVPGQVGKGKAHLSDHDGRVLVTLGGLPGFHGLTRMCFECVRAV